MTRHELSARAAGQASSELAVEGAQPRGEPLGLLLAVELVPDPLRELRVPDRIEPDMGVGAGVLDGVEEVDRLRRGGVDRVLEGGLESLAEVEDEIRVRDRAHVAAGELEIVRLDAGRGQVPYLELAPPDLLGGERERVEGGDDGSVARAGVRAATSGQHEGYGE